MTAKALNRFEWLKAVMQAECVSDSAARVATALAIQFANDDTGQINPSVKTLSRYLNKSVDTVKRAIRILVDTGWLGRTEGRGRGNRTEYTMCSPGKVVVIPNTKKGANATHTKGGNPAPLDEEKGANLRGKGSKSAPSYNKAKQSYEQKGRDPRKTRWNSYRFAGNPWDGLRPIRSDNNDALSDWGHWLKSHDLPALYSIPINAVDEKTGSKFFFLPWLSPPEDERRKSEALEYFADMIDAQEVRYAAE